MNQLTISSPVFDNDGFIPTKYTADGDDISPPLIISGVSPKAKSLTLIVDDPDAATDPDGPGKTFDHWLLFNIPTETAEIRENNTPQEAAEGLNSFGQSSYLGPAPPNGTHRYYFRLYELSDTLDLDQHTTKQELLIAMEDIILGTAELIGKYQRL